MVFRTDQPRQHWALAASHINPRWRGAIRGQRCRYAKSHRQRRTSWAALMGIPAYGRPQKTFPARCGRSGPILARLMAVRPFALSELITIELKYQRLSTYLPF